MRVLTEEAENERASFESEFGNKGCTCFISPPCSFCTHPGNPLNQDNDDTAWEDVDLVCVDNKGIEDKFDEGVEYVVEDSDEKDFVYAYDKNGSRELVFRKRFDFKR